MLVIWTNTIVKKEEEGGKFRPHFKIGSTIIPLQFSYILPHGFLYIQIIQISFGCISSTQPIF